MTHKTMDQLSNLPIKGVRDGLLLSVKHIRPAKLTSELRSLLAERRGFLAGSRLALDVGGRHLEQTDLVAIGRVLAEMNIELWAILTSDSATREAARKAGLATRLPGTATDLEGNELPAEFGPEQEGVPKNVTDHSVNALLLQETLRSGRSVHHDGHIIIMGDVNRGAEIVATGNVLVWGRLLGVVHAGAAGDRSACVCALGLSPTQLRIADKITISPAGGPVRREPEMASIQNNQIVAERWHS